MANKVDDYESYIYVVAKDGGCELTKRTYTADRDKQIGASKEERKGMLDIDLEENE